MNSHVVVAVYDSKADVFMAPLTAPNIAVATRWFTGVVQDPQSDFYRFPEDYTLFELGVFEPKSGKLESHATPKSVVGAWMMRKDIENA